MSYIFFNSAGGSKNQALFRFPEIKVMNVFIPVNKTEESNFYKCLDLVKMSESYLCGGFLG